MASTCECGMTVEVPGRRSDCRDCGTACCRSCVIDIETETYCRWCASAFMTA